MKRANFTVMDAENDRITIRDVGPWSLHRTVTIDAENVVERLVLSRRLAPGMRLFYWNSHGGFGEIRVSWPDGRFAGFGPGPGVAS